MNIILSWHVILSNVTLTWTECSKVEALEYASLHPAKLLGIGHQKGTLDYGSDADFIILDDELTVKATYIAGQQVWKDPSLTLVAREAKWMLAFFQSAVIDDVIIIWLQAIFSWVSFLEKCTRTLIKEWVATATVLCVVYVKLCLIFFTEIHQFAVYSMWI